MAAKPTSEPISTLLVDESFASENEAFVDQVRQVILVKYLAALADRWKKDPRPWAREQIFAYLALPLDRLGHHPLVKRLFKHAEAAGDHEVVGAFLVAFDRLVRRQRRMRSHYDWQTRQVWTEELLLAPRNQILATRGNRSSVDPKTGQRVFGKPWLWAPRSGRLFSYRTRRYLQRRAWRYFRRLGIQHPTSYCAAAVKALARYRDEDVALGENILDSWSLAHMAFGRSPVLRFYQNQIGIAQGQSLAELTAAPRFPELWQSADAAAQLLWLLTAAQSRLVRVWAMQLLKRDHTAALATIRPEQLLALLDHADEEVQEFGASLLETLAGVDSWPIETWLALLETRSVSALAVICQSMQARVRPERLTFEQCVALACARATPVARLGLWWLGLAWLRPRSVLGEAERAALVRLAAAKCDAVGAELSEFALAKLGAAGEYRTDEVVRFFDSLNAEVRRGAWNWLTPASAGYGDAELWSRLLETPYDDVRVQLVQQLQSRAKSTPPAGLRRQDLAPLWSMVLLNVHRGGRAKLVALRQISAAIAADPQRAEPLIPVLAVAIRSVRPAEARAGLAAILAAIAARPELEALLARYLPELRLLPQEAQP